MSQRKPTDNWKILTRRIIDLCNACRADEMKGGGDPLNIREIELYLAYCNERLNSHIAKMHREYEERE